MAKPGYEEKERNIIVNSEFARREFPKLYGFMQRNPKITSMDFDQLSAEDKEIIDRPSVLEVLSASKLEWEIVKDGPGDFKVTILDSRSERCKICNTRIKNIYYIRNMVTQAIMLVGCECIKGYEIGADIKDFKNLASKQLKSKQKAWRIKKLNLDYPEVHEFLKITTAYLTTNEYALPKAMEDAYKETYQKLNTIINGYLENGSNDEYAEIGNLYESLLQQRKQHSELFVKQRDNRWALTTRMRLNLDESSAGAIQEALLESATISGESLYLINDADFRKRVIEDLRSAVKHIGFNVIACSPDGNKIYLGYKPKSITHEITVNYREFAKAYGQLLFNDTFVTPSAALFIAENEIDVNLPYIPDALQNLETFFPQGIRFYRDKDSWSIVVTNNWAYLLFPAKKSSAGYRNAITVDCSIVLHNLYKYYLINDGEKIEQWALERSKATTGLIRMDDVRDTVRDQERGSVYNPRYIRNR